MLAASKTIILSISLILFFWDFPTCIPPFARLQPHCCCYCTILADCLTYPWGKRLLSLYGALAWRNCPGDLILSRITWSFSWTTSPSDFTLYLGSILNWAVFPLNSNKYTCKKIALMALITPNIATNGSVRERERKNATWRWRKPSCQYHDRSGLTHLTFDLDPRDLWIWPMTLTKFHDPRCCSSWDMN